MRWYWVSYQNGWGHMVTGDLLDAVRADMDRQDPPGAIRTVSPMTPEDCALHIDQGGMMAVDRPTEVVEFLGLEIVVPSEDLRDLARDWARAPAVASAGRTFHRFASCGRCLVVAQDRRDELLALLRSRVESAEARAWEFYARRDTPQESLRRLNEARGVVLEYGPDRLGRFRSS